MLRPGPLALTFALLTLCASGARAQESAPGQLALLSRLTTSQLGTSRLSDCWGYVSPSGREYAIVCLRNGTAFVEITTPTAPVIVATHAGPVSNWRDVKVYQDHCYAVSEGGGGVQVFDMSAIDSGVVTYPGDITAGGSLSTHNVAIDERSGFLYRLGGSMRIYDLDQSLTSPPLVGTWSAKYVHDAQIVTYASGPAAGKQVAYTLNGSSGGLTILDVTDKGNITVMDTVGWTFQSYPHQGWLDKDRKYFYANDEGDEINLGLPTTTIVIDVGDPYNAFVASKFDNGNTAIGHNAYIAGEVLYAANDTSGLRVFDLSVDPLNPPETTFYDTYPADDLPTYNGLWSCYPLFPSGLVIGSDRTAGLFVWSPEQVQIELQAAVPPFLQQSGQVLPVSVTELVPGALVPGTETLHHDDGSGWQAAPLVNVGGTSYEARFPDLPCGAQVDYYLSAQSAVGVTWTDPPGGAADAYVSPVATSSVAVFHDDFETNQGWVAENAGATAGDFERGVPVNDPNWPFDPLADADGSGQCWVTENALGSTDVDDGKVRVVSPPLDLTGSSVVVQYDYYLYITDESGIDRLAVKANDNAGSGWVEVAAHATSGGTDWRRGYLLGSDFISVGVSLTSGVQLRFSANDSDPQSTVEAGLDAFFVLELSCNPVTSYCTAGATASGCQVQLSTTGTPSLSLASGFTVAGASGEGSKNGLFYFGQNGRQANTWGNGESFQCVAPPVRRTPLVVGSGTGGACDGSWSIDFNAWAAANPIKAPTAGTPTQLQLWLRDPQNTSNQTTSLSDAVEFTPAP